MSRPTTIAVTGDAGYDITVGRGILRRVGEALAARRRARCSSSTRRRSARAGRAAARALSSDGDREVLLAEIPDAEQGKRIEVAAFCWQVMGKADFTRTDAVVGFGGGAVTDLAGFVAATWLRGVAGRAGADDRARHGRRRRRRQDRRQHRRGQEPRRRLLGAARGACATSTCSTRSRANERVAGFAEVVKAGFIWYPEILDLIEADPEAAVDPRERRVPPLHRAGDRR